MSPTPAPNHEARWPASSSRLPPIGTVDPAPMPEILRRLNHLPQGDASPPTVVARLPLPPNVTLACITRAKPLTLQLPRVARGESTSSPPDAGPAAPGLSAAFGVRIDVGGPVVASPAICPVSCFGRAVICQHAAGYGGSLHRNSGCFGGTHQRARPRTERPGI